MDNLSWTWALVVVAGPVILLAALAWAKLRTSRTTRDGDPDTPSDDPSKGMIGHD